METAEQVTSFEFYDKKNNNRVTLVKNLVNQQMSTLVGIEKQLATVKDKLQKNDKFLNEYDQMQVNWKQEKEKLVENLARLQAASDQEAKSQRTDRLDDQPKQKKQAKSKGKKKKEP